MLTELAGLARLGVAALIGLAVGLEREWSGHATGPDARFAGLRTFALLGLLGATAGLAAAQGFAVAGAIALGGGMAITIAAYVAAARGRESLDGTTEVAAAVVLMLGLLAGLGWLVAASATGAITVFLLNEKRQLHGLVKAIDQRELRAGLQFAVLAVVVLPLLPEGPYLGPLAVHPRALWTVVLAFCALNFATYIVRRLVGAKQGYGIAGALGGMMSSTAVTLSYARRSRLPGESSAALARGVIAACAVLVPRILVISGALSPRVALAAAPYLLPSLAAAFFLVFMVRNGEAATDGELAADDRSPLRFISALQLALAFQVAISLLGLLKDALGAVGIYGAAVVLGLTDMDALTVSMSRSSTIGADVAGCALGIGMLANTTFKLSIAVVMGSTAFRRRASMGLGLLGALTLAALLLL